MKRKCGKYLVFAQQIKAYKVRNIINIFHKKSYGSVGMLNFLPSY